jgi:hypothetical protein
VGDTPNSVARDRRRNTAASRAGLKRLDVRFAGAWGRALVDHILARNGPERGVWFLSVMKGPWVIVQRAALGEAARIKASQAEMQALRKSREIFL